jgi:hypothetical protein
VSFEGAEVLRERAESFLRNAEELFLKGVYDLDGEDRDVSENSLLTHAPEAFIKHNWRVRFFV